jgi:hypothetical protein
LWYAYPFNKEPKSKLDFYSFNYCHPYFYQDWRMFTPPPKFNYTIYAIYKVHGQTHYSLPIQEVLYQRNAFNGKEFLMLSFTNSCEFIHSNSIYLKNHLYQIRNDKYAKVLKHTAYQYLRKKHRGDILNLKLMIEVRDIVTKEKGYLVE